MSRRWIICGGWKQVVEYACRSGGKSDEAVAVDGGSRSGRSRSSSLPSPQIIQRRLIRRQKFNEQRKGKEGQERLPQTGVDEWRLLQSSTIWVFDCEVE